MEETPTTAEVTVTRKLFAILISCGRRGDAFQTRRTPKVKQVIEDYNNLGQKALKEKYFGKIPKKDRWITDGGRIWLEGYSFAIEFSDGSAYIVESMDGDYGCTSGESQGGQNMKRIFGDQEHSEIFPKEFEIIGDNL